MDTEKDNKQVIREMLEGYEIQPSAGVWEAIEAASPAPVSPPRIIRPWVYGAAAILIVAGIIMLLIPAGQPEDAVMDQVEILVPEVSYNMQETDNPEAVSSGDIAAVAANAPSTTGQSSAETSTPQPKVSDDVVLQEPLPVDIPSERKAPKDIPAKITQPVSSVSTAPSPTAKSSETAIQTEVAISNENQTSSPDNTSVPKGKLRVFIPNAFAPNGNGTNDIFRPVIKDNAEVTDYLMQIYTRSGALLFESKNIENGWNGRFHGVPVDDQVCVYVITFRDLEGFPYRHWGTVVIVK